MRAKFFTLPFVAISCAVSLAFTTAARADDDGELGGAIEGNETLDAEIAMTPTAAAPTGSMAEVSLEVEDEDGSTSARLEVEADGLLAGTYSVGATLKSNGGTVILGTFTVDNEGEGKFELRDEAAFPLNFNPLDIATVFIADANSVVLFTADLTSAASGSSMNLNATVMMVAGPANPNASGTAT